MTSFFQGVSPAALAGAVGITAGSINGVALNQLAIVKYHTWNDAGVGSFSEAARKLYRVGGAKAFFRGAAITGARCTFSDKG